MYLSRAMDKLGTTSLNKDYQEPDISAAFIKFSVVTKELSILMKTLVSDSAHQSKQNILYIDCATCVI
jgi:hypothetical protein